MSAQSLLQSPPAVFNEAEVSKDINDKICRRTNVAVVGGNSALCTRAATRLSALLPVVVAQSPEKRAPIQDKFLDTVAKFLNLLRVHNHYNFKLYWLAHSQRLVGQVRQTHTRIDEIYKDLGVAEDPALANWQEKIAEDLQEQVRWFVKTVGDMSEALLVNEVANPTKLKDMLIMLKNQLEVRLVRQESMGRVSPTAEMASLMRETLDRVTAFKDVHLGDAFEWYVPAEDVKKVSKEAFKAGTFGQLYEGTWTDPWSNETRKVAIKQLDQIGALDNNKRFSRELETWSGLKNKNILELLGANHMSDRKFFISDFATEGNFFNFFQQQDDDNKRLLWSLFKQAVAALKFLHENKVEHGGLKTTNLLVTRDEASGELVVKVSDFGMAIVRTESVAVSVVAQSQMVRWKAPERLMQATGPVDFSKSDLYSLGLCLCDAASGETPYGTEDDDTIITSKLNGDPIPRPDGAFTDREWELVSRMIDSDPANRPTVDEVISIMNELDVVRQRDWPFAEAATRAPDANAA